MNARPAGECGWDARAAAAALGLTSAPLPVGAAWLTGRENAVRELLTSNGGLS